MVVEVVWVDCVYRFDETGVLVEITTGLPTIDGIAAGDSESVIGPILGQPVQTDGNTRLYVADETQGWAWRVTIENGKITRITLCRCLTPKAGVASCGSDKVPPTQDMLQAALDASVQILRVDSVVCTSKADWAIAQLYILQNGVDRGGTLVVHRQNGVWVKTTLITHGGNCVPLAQHPDAPLDEINAAVNGLCSFVIGPMKLWGQPVTGSGIGDLKLGMTATDAEGRGYLFLAAGENCNAGYRSVSTLDDLRVYPRVGETKDRRQIVDQILVSDAGWRTAAGGRVGMSASETRRLYPGATRRDSYWSSEYLLTMKDGIGYLVFVIKANSDTVDYIMVNDTGGPRSDGC